MEVDDKRRGDSGVVCSLRELGEGRIRLVLDDVKNGGSPGQGPWMHHTLFTFKDFNIEEITELQLSEKELAAFGFQILARLIALREHPIA